MLQLLLMVSCEKKEPEVSNSIIGLKQHITLIQTPASVQWVVKQSGDPSRAPGPTDYTLTAILTYSRQDFAKLNDFLRHLPRQNDHLFINPNAVEPWFTPTIKNSFYKEEKYLKVTPNVYPADYFIKSPFVNGYCFVTKNYEVYLYVYTG